MNIDAKEDRSKIPAYLKKNNLSSRVLLVGDAGLDGYQFEASDSLFVVDRKGMLAGMPSQFYFKLEEELDRRLPGLLAGEPTPGPLLCSLRKAPGRFGELWHTSTEAAITDIAIA